MILTSAQLKSRYNFGILIKIETFLSETKKKFNKKSNLLFFPTSWGNTDLKSLMMEKIGSLISPLKPSFGMSNGISPKILANLGFGIGIGPKPK